MRNGECKEGEHVLRAKIDMSSPNINMRDPTLYRIRYESHHGCQYTDDALEAAVKISSRYIPDRFLPDKALDLIDEAGSKARIDR